TTLREKLPILNPAEYDLWLMRIEKYFLMTDYSLWEVIKNGNKVLKRTVRIVKQTYEPTSTKEKLNRRNEMKARGTLLMALPNKDQLKFHSYQDAKFLMEAIEKRYGGNKESKKVQKTLLKQQYENFAASITETLDQTFDRLQKLIGQLEIQGEVIGQEDMNLKLLRSLPSEWKTHALIWRNKAEIETISLDDLYNNLKIYEPELTGSSSTSQNPQNVAFVSSNSTSSTTETDNTANRVNAAHTQVNTVNSTSVDNLSDAMICAFLASQQNFSQFAKEDLEQIDLDDLEEMDLHWEMAMLTIRARRFIKRTGKNLDMNGQRIGFDRSKVECFNCHKHGHFARECRAPKNQEYKGKDYQADEEQQTNFALMAYTSSGSSSSSDSEVDSCSKSYVKAYAILKEQYDDLSSDYKKSQFNLVSDLLICSTEVSPEVRSFVNTYNMLKTQENEKSKADKGYHAVPPPYSGNFMPPKPDLMFIDEQVESEFVDVVSNVESGKVNNVKSNQETADKGIVETNTIRKNSSCPPIIEDWNSYDDNEEESTPNKTVRPSIKFVKSARETVEKIETSKQNKHHPRGNQRNWNNIMSQRLGSDFKMINKACYVCSSFEHLHYVCDKKTVRSVWNNSSRVNHKNFSNKLTHPHPKRGFVLQAVLTRSGKINTAGASVNTVAKQVNIVDPKTTVNHPRLKSNAFKRGYSHHTRSFNKFSTNKNSIFNKKVNTVSVNDSIVRHRAVLSENMGKGVNVVKASACWI
ncbi:ribonuclease H-like domain-containing protein, partial [Tanacetum coccineum]